MTVVDFLTTKDGAIVGYHINGHSGNNTFGKDIVCAAISSAAYMAANTITEVIGVNADITVNDGEMLLEIAERDFSVCKDILLGFKLHMVDLEEQYPDNINVNYTEV